MWVWISWVLKFRERISKMSPVRENARTVRCYFRWDCTAATLEASPLKYSLREYGFLTDPVKQCVVVGRYIIKWLYTGVIYCILCIQSTLLFDVLHILSPLFFSRGKLTWGQGVTYL